MRYRSPGWRLSLWLCVVWLIPSVTLAARDAKVTMLLWDGVTPNEQGFQEGLRAAGYNVTFEILDVHGNAQELQDVVQRLQPAQMDLLYVSTVTVLTAVLAQVTVTPILFRIDSHAATHDTGEQLKLRHPHITGICNGVQFGMQQRGMEKLLNIKRLGVIYDPLHEDARADHQLWHQTAEKERFSLIDAPVSEAAQLPEAIATLATARVDVLYLPPDPFVVRHSKTIVQLATQQGIPTFTGVERLVVDSGALFALSNNSYELGKVAAKQATRILQGESPAKIPVGHSTDFAPIINLATAGALQMKIPVNVLLAAKKVRTTH